MKIKYRILMCLILAQACGVRAYAGDTGALTITRSNGTIEKTQFATGACSTTQPSACTRQIAVVTTRATQSTYVWQPTIVTQVVSQVVVQQPVIIERPVVYDTPRYVAYTTPLLSVSAYAGVSSYGSYYPQTYWQYNSREQEYHNIAQTRHAYGLRPGPSYHSHGYTGYASQSGVRSFAPVRFSPSPNRARSMSPPPPSGSGHRR